MMCKSYQQKAVMMMMINFILKPHIAPSLALLLENKEPFHNQVKALLEINSKTISNHNHQFHFWFKSNPPRILPYIFFLILPPFLLPTPKRTSNKYPFFLNLHLLPKR
jgi:hypothetical protein